MPDRSSSIFPHFLVIGAMKAGTTTLYEDLRAHRSVFVPEKELSYLLREDITSPSGRTQYVRLFRAATIDQVAGEVCSPYAKLPESRGATEHASALLGTDFKVIYLVRDPVDRVVSQHYHEFARGQMPSSVDEAVREVPRLIGYSKYATQLAPWTDAVGAANIRVVKFEDYIRDRPGTLASLLAFLGVPAEPSVKGYRQAHNVSGDQPAAVGRMRTFVQSTAYRSMIRPMLPVASRRRLGQALFPRLPPRPALPTVETVDRVIDQVAPELSKLARLCDVGPELWNLGATRQRYQRLAGPVAD